MVSIIIPAYNRGHLIGATLDSIIAQTYRNWECIVVDDDSVDATEELMEFYCELDKRIQFHRRPRTSKKGANPCRNYGFELSSGKYIQWFDSDDLMVPEFLERKVAILENHDVDYVISKTYNFLDPNRNEIISKNKYYYKFDEFPITNYDYVSQRINWLTCDFMGNRDVLDRVRFSEILRSAQEYNFFCKLTCYSTRAFVLDEYLTFRRIHSNSIQTLLKEDNRRMTSERFLVNWETMREIKKIGDSASLEFLFLKSLKSTLENSASWKATFVFAFNLLKKSGFVTTLWYLSYQILFKSLGKGHFCRIQLKKRIPL